MLQMVSSYVHLFQKDIQDSCEWSKTILEKNDFSDFSVWSLISLTFVLDTSCDGCTDVLVQKMRFRACGKPCVWN